MQTVIPFDFSHDGFLPLVVLPVAYHLPGVSDAVRQNVDVLVLSVVVPDYDELVICETHPAQIALSDLAPLLICKLFAGGGG